jgi:hypothetical protein
LRTSRKYYLNIRLWFFVYSNVFYCHKIIIRRDGSDHDKPIIQGTGYNSEQFILLLDDGMDNTPETRSVLVTNFVNFLNNEVTFRFPSTFILGTDETVYNNGKVGCLDRYMMNADIAGFLGRYVFDSSASEVMADQDILNEIFENPKNKALVTTFMSQFWNSWN